MTPGGVLLARSIRRLPLQDRYDCKLLAEACGRPYSLKAVANDTPVIQIELPPQPAEGRSYAGRGTGQRLRRYWAESLLIVAHVYRAAVVLTTTRPVLHNRPSSMKWN